MVIITIPLMHKPSATTGMSSIASGGIGACTTTAITAKIARQKPKSELINPFQNIINPFIKCVKCFINSLTVSRRVLKHVNTCCMYPHMRLDSYFRKHNKHLHTGGEGLVISLIWGGVAYQTHSLLKSAQIYSNPAIDCDIFATVRNPLWDCRDSHG